MKASQNSLALLKEFSGILHREKEALLKNDGATIEALVQEKQRFLEILPTVDFADSDRAEIERNVKAIQQLQETNLLLTKQALSYQETIMDALAQGAKKSSATYSKKGQYQAVERANLIDHSL